MADPSKYTPNYSFTGYQTATPGAPLPAPQVDTEFANVALSVGQAVDAIKDIRRADGKLANQSVGPDQLSAALSIGFTNRGTWTSGRSYNAGDGVSKGTSFYSARVANVAATGNAPDVDTTTWQLLFVLTTSVDVADSSITQAKMDPTYDASLARVASPTFTGTPAGPTATVGTNTTQLATTAFVQVAVAPSTLLAALKTVDGSSSGLDADLLDGHDSTYFQPAIGYTPVNKAGDTMTGSFVTNGTLQALGGGLYVEGWSANPAVGVVFFGSSHTKYLYGDGTNLTLSGLHFLDDTGNRVYSAGNPPPAPAVGQPIPTSSTLAVGTMIHAFNNSGGTVTDGSTIAGSSLQRMDILKGSTPQALGGPVVSGTWTNVHGGSVTTGHSGQFVRTA